jgi:hypothetical protein
MAQEFTVGIRGLLQPEVDKRSSRTARQDIQDDVLQEVEELQPEMNTQGLERAIDKLDLAPNLDTGQIQDQLENVDLGQIGADAVGGGAMSTVATSQTGGGGRGGVGSGAAAGGMVARAGAGSLAKVALGGAVAVGMLGTLKTIKDLTMASSPALQTTAGLFDEAMRLFFRPFGNFLSKLLRPATKKLFEMAKNFNKSVGNNGLAVASVEGFTGIDFSEDSLGEKIGSALGAGAGMGAGALAGAKAGGAVGATAGSIIPGAGTAAGGTAGAIIGAIVGAIGGSALGARIGEAIGGAAENAGKYISDKLSGFSLPAFSWPDLPAFTWPTLPAFPGWPAITAQWPGWPDVTGNWPGWPNLSGLFPGWPDLGGLFPGWPNIGALWPGWPDLSFNGWATYVDSLNWGSFIDGVDLSSWVSGGKSRVDLQTGGIVTQPTNAKIGEAGPEAVIPLSEMGQVMSQVRAPARTQAQTQRSGEGVDRLEQKLDEVVRELRNLGGDVTLEVDGRRFGKASTETTAKYQASRELNK